MNRLILFLRPVIAIGKVTFQEIIRDKVLYNIFLLAFLLFGISVAATTLTFITPERVVLDIGFSAINLSCGLIAVLNGCAMLAKEYDRRTIFVALARPISRFQFAWGKYLGLCAVVTLNWGLLAGLETWLYAAQQGQITGSYFIALIFLLFQSWALAALSIMVSSFTTTSIAVIIVIGIYMLGNNVSEILKLVAKLDAPAVETLLKIFVRLIPNLEHYNLGFQVTYLLPITGSQMGVTVTYTAVLVALCLGFSGVLLKKRENS